MPVANEVKTSFPQVDEGWLRGVLFEKGIDGWGDLAPDPAACFQISVVFAEQYESAYQMWKWLAGLRGSDPEQAPSADAAEPLAMVLGLDDWTELTVALAVVPLAQALLVADLLAAADETAKRSLGRVYTDLRSHTSLGFWLLSEHPSVDRDKASSYAHILASATDRWLETIGIAEVHAAWRSHAAPLLAASGCPVALTGR
jgi:hypothetical protein